MALGGYPAPPQLSGTTQTGTSSTWDTTNSVVHSADSISTFEGSRVKRACAEFTVIRRGFVFHQPHPASNAWEATYGGERDALRAYQVGPTVVFLRQQSAMRSAGRPTAIASGLRRGSGTGFSFAASGIPRKTPLDMPCGRAMAQRDWGWAHFYYPEARFSLPGSP